MLWILDASINVSMEPFRAYVADQLPPHQRPLGYSMQSFFIGVGCVVASSLPWLLAKAGVANTAAAGGIPDTVRYAFYVGGAIQFAAIAWTVFSTQEYPPEALRSFDDAGVVRRTKPDAGRTRRDGAIWLGLGIAALLIVYQAALYPQL